MSRKVSILGGIVGVAILIMAVGVFLAPKEGTEIPVPNQITPPIGQTDNIAPTGGLTYEEFLKGGRSEICHFVTNVDNTTTTGTVYAAHGKIRADFVVTYDKGTLQQHILADSLLGYMWTNLSNEGVKFALEDNSENPGGLDQILGPDGRFNLECEEWSPNLQVFEIPPNIIFKEVTGFNELREIIQPTQPIQPQPTQP